ncbi:hypothetical protein [Shewanella marina]|uniref:hypothetical protein n=1 Tax=Shewanella marina TaxID=487319 RepID=UPI000472FC95|nr:hypothetical protein [Shewanella marina]
MNFKVFAGIGIVAVGFAMLHTFYDRMDPVMDKLNLNAWQAILILLTGIALFCLFSKRFLGLTVVMLMITFSVIQHNQAEPKIEPTHASTWQQLR